MQTNGLFLTHEIIQRLNNVGLSRINISLNTFDKELAADLTSCHPYDINSLVKHIRLLLDSQINVLIAPVWFPGVNDNDIEDIIKFVSDLRSQGYSNTQIQIGIQKYLTYKTGRTLKKIRPKTWGYFYNQLSDLEDKYNLKLKLGPNDFGIHERRLYSLNVKPDELLSVKIISPGRWSKEAIGKVDENFAIKVLLNSPVSSSSQVIGKDLKVRILRTSDKDNIITAFFPPKEMF
jgi:hypothetical protein